MTKRLALGATVLMTLASLPALAADVEVHDPYARATAPGAKVGAAFLTLVNRGETTRLTGAATDIAETVQLHNHTMDADGVMRMREVEGGIALPAGETVTLAPGGLHIMLMSLRGMLVEGETLDLTLEFADGGSMPLTVPVRSIAAMGAAHGHSGHKKMHKSMEPAN